jgi:hypothetical protein
VENIFGLLQLHFEQFLLHLHNLHNLKIAMEQSKFMSMLVRCAMAVMSPTTGSHCSQGIVFQFPQLPAIILRRCSVASLISSCSLLWVVVRRQLPRCATKILALILDQVVLRNNGKGEIKLYKRLTD